MRRTKIVATVGPASREPETLMRMIDAGLDVARLNFSHGSRELHAENAERIRAAAKAVGRQVAILQDLPGPKLRIGPLQNDIAELKRGDKLVLICGAGEVGNAQRMAVTWAGLAGAVEREDVMYLRRSDPAAGRGGPRRRRRDRNHRRGGGHGGLAAGPQHSRIDSRSARGPGAGP